MTLDEIDTQLLESCTRGHPFTKSFTGFNFDAIS